MLPKFNHIILLKSCLIYKNETSSCYKIHFSDSFWFISNSGYLTGNAAVSESFCHIKIHTIILQRIQSLVSDIKAHNIKT
jgi:hemerythrin